MNAVEFPPSERVNLVGNFTRGEVVGAAVAAAVFAVGLMVGRPIPALGVVGVVLLWTFTPTRRHPFRTIVPAHVRWVVRRDRKWSAPIKGRGRNVPRFMRGVEVVLASDTTSGPVGVVVHERSFTVMFRVDRAALTFSTEQEQAEALAAWGEVLGALCVERHTELTAERIAWTDVHRASDPGLLDRHHAVHGVAGPASADYAEYLSTFGTLAAEHEVIVSATVTQAGRLRVAKRTGLRGSVSEVMQAAAIHAGRVLRGDLADRGFATGELMSPAEIGRVLTQAMDPYRPTELPTRRERFALAERIIPENQVTIERDMVIVDRAYHRCFVVTMPTVAVHATWLWKPLAVDGPKIMTTVFEPVPPSKADRQRNSRRSIGSRNNAAAATEGDGHVNVKNRRKVDALHRAEERVSEGHGEHDAFMLVVVSANSRELLDKRCHTLRRKLRECGHASMRELSGEHDLALAAALPLGVRVETDGG